MNIQGSTDQDVATDGYTSDDCYHPYRDLIQAESAYIIGTDTAQSLGAALSHDTSTVLATGVLSDDRDRTLLNVTRETAGFSGGFIRRGTQHPQIARHLITHTNGEFVANSPASGGGVVAG